MRSAQLQPFDQSLPMLLYGALDAVMPPFRQIFKEFGLTEQQWRVLRVLWEHTEVSFGDLARQTLISPPSLVGVIDRIIALGYVERRRCDDDRRIVYVQITDSGKQLEQQVLPKVEGAYAELEASVEPLVWTNLVAALGHIAQRETHNEQRTNTKRA